MHATFNIFAVAVFIEHRWTRALYAESRTTSTFVGDNTPNHKQPGLRLRDSRICHSVVSGVIVPESHAFQKLINRLPLRRSRGLRMRLRIRVERVNLFLVELLEMAATELHARSERAVFDTELGVNHQHPL
jgi:hypothetical protein